MCIGLHVKYPNSCHILMKLEFSQQTLEKYSDLKLDENSSIGSRVVPSGQTHVQSEGQTDRHDEANSCVSQFC
jgi:hypothetical protein